MLAPVGPGLGPELGLPAARFCTEIFIFARFYKGFTYSRREYKKVVLVHVLHFFAKICAALQCDATEYRERPDMHKKAFGFPASAPMWLPWGPMGIY